MQKNIQICLEEDEDKVEELIQFGAYVQISASAVVGDLGQSGPVDDPFHNRNPVSGHYFGRKTAQSPLYRG